MGTVIWWVRRDFRLDDNPALDAALAAADAVLPVFVLDPFFVRSPYAGPKRFAFMLGGLRALDAALRERGSRLIVRRGSPEDVLPRLAADSGADKVFAQADFSQYARRRDAEVGARVVLTLTEGLTAHPPEAVLKADGDPYLVFTPYSRRWRSLTPPDSGSLLPAPGSIPTPEGVESELIPGSPALPAGVPFTPGETAALDRLAAFTAGDDAPIFSYHVARNRVDLGSTSRLSPYLRWGMLSPRRAVAAAYEAIERAPGKDAETSAQTWLDELIWREFYASILYHHPHVLGANFREKYDAVPWRADEDGLRAWQEGRTGYPLVDAAMRALRAEGWLHNRARMVVASFLTKDLLIDWRLGERWFMQHLVDGDPAQNNGGWQWAAGTGTDAAPYFRIFNPTSQARKHDPDGAYIRRWLPELSAVPDEHIHQPWAMDTDVQKAARCVIGQDYPAPILDHAAARERTLAAYGEA